MRELTVLSGKGGTGRTSLVASFAALAENAVVADCDVDAPDLALLLSPCIEKATLFISGKRAQVDANRCNDCGKCAELCRFGAISAHGVGNTRAERTRLVDPLACEGCGVCVEFCPEKALELIPAQVGEWFISRTRHGPMVHAQLGIAQDNSGKLVSAVRREAKTLAEGESLGLVICDGPPGIGCPAIASLSGASLALVTVEPTVAGIHDFERVVKLIDHFQVAGLACINKFDINEEMTTRVEELAARLGVEPVGRIPYDRTVVTAQLARTSVVEYGEGKATAAIRRVWGRVKTRLDAGVIQDTKRCLTR